ncbi:UNVERIFIED_CONTAM: hypothetical protein Sindi_2460200 [Sesamum indicum]
MEKVALEFLDTADGQHYLEGYWVSRLEQFKKSKSYKRELAKITAPYFGHGFVACKEKLKAHGYPPPEKDPSFLDISTTMKNAPDPFLDAPALEEEDLDNILGEAEAEVRSLPPKAAINSKARDFPGMGD